jgi:hypothetical protein
MSVTRSPVRQSIFSHAGARAYHQSSAAGFTASDFFGSVVALPGSDLGSTFGSAFDVVDVSPEDVLVAGSECDAGRLSVLYQPEPLKMTPAGYSTRRTVAPHWRQSVIGASLKLWRTSNRCPHELQAYSYVGIARAAFLSLIHRNHRIKHRIIPDDSGGPRRAALSGEILHFFPVRSDRRFDPEWHAEFRGMLHRFNDELSKGVQFRNGCLE